MKNSIFLLVLFLSSSFNINAQWLPDVRLTNDPNYSYTTFNNAWCVAASGNYVHVVWLEYRMGTADIFYKHSSDKGLSWGIDTRLTGMPWASSNPSITASGAVVHVVWHDSRDGNSEIYYKRSTDNGINWEVDKRLTNNSAESKYPCITVSGSIVHAVWADNRNGDYQIYYKRSADGGSNWGADTVLTVYTYYSIYPSVSSSGSSVNIVWPHWDNGHNDLYHKFSTNGGQSWESDIQLINNTGYASISVSGSEVHVVYSDRDNLGDRDICYKLSTNGGINWKAEMRLGETSAWDDSPSITSSGSAIHLSWDGYGGIHYKHSTDRGINWSADIQLTSGPSHHSSVSVFDSVVHVVWTDSRDGNPEIYYKRNPTGNLVGITNINTEIPKEFSLSQNYPNPFNPSTKIRFEIPLSPGVSGSAGRGVFVKLIIYDVMGREIESLISGDLKPGTYEVDWSAANYPSGVYFYTLRTTGFTETKRMLLVK